MTDSVFYGRKDCYSMEKLVFLLEEQSMKEVLTVILPKIIPQTYTFQCVNHKGKSALRKSIPIKTRGWGEPYVRFIIVYDKDSADCKSLKREIYELIDEHRRSDTLIRIVCTELESWFLGDLDAVEKAFSIDLSEKKNKSIYQNPDAISNAKQELKLLVPKYQPILGSKCISEFMDISKNKSKSFQVFISGIHRVCK